ncbi:effector-associated constant component EACC1 [Streptomyces sp. NPDC002446]
MRVEIIVDGDGAELTPATGSLASLYRWLIQDPDVAQQAEVSLGTGPARPGAMGGAFEVINAVVTHGIALGSLAVACATWRAARPSAPAVRIERDGVTVTVEDGSPETVRRIVDALGEPQAPAGGAGTDQQR